MQNCRTNYTIKITIYEMIDHYTYESMNIHWTGLTIRRHQSATNRSQCETNENIVYFFGEIWVKS